jgi:hypothetical protein
VSAREVDDRGVLEVAGGGHHQVLSHISGVVIGSDLGDRDRREHVGAPEHPASERMVAEHGFGEHVVDAVGRLVLVHRDLLEDDGAL